MVMNVEEISTAAVIQTNRAARFPRPPISPHTLSSRTEQPYRRAAFLSLPGLVAPVSVVPSSVPLPVPALGVIPAE